MKSRFAVLAALVAFALPLAAQGGPPGDMRNTMTAVPNVDTLAAQLSLTAEQKPTVAAAVTAFEVATKDARDAMTKLMSGGDMAAMRDNPDAQKSMTTIREERTKMVTAIKAAITAEQAAKYDELYPQRRRPGGQ
jgi:Spy/CpxP family protein refolding chaperone